MDEIEEDAIAYWKTLQRPPDGWGQHYHPHYGASHWMLMFMCRKHGQEAFEKALDATHGQVFRPTQEKEKTDEGQGEITGD